MSTQAQVFDTAGVISLIISVFLPILVGLVNKESNHPGIKAVALLALSLITQVAHSAYDAVENHTHWGWQPVVYGVVVSFVTGTALHFGLWSPIGVSSFAAKHMITDDTEPATPLAVTAGLITGPTHGLQSGGQPFRPEDFEPPAPWIAPAQLPPPTEYVQLLPIPYPEAQATEDLFSTQTIPPVGLQYDRPWSEQTGEIPTASLIPPMPDVPPAEPEPLPIEQAAQAAAEAEVAAKPVKRAYVRKAPVKKAVAKKVPAKKAPAKKAVPVKRASR